MWTSQLRLGACGALAALARRVVEKSWTIHGCHSLAGNIKGEPLKQTAGRKRKGKNIFN